MHDPPHILIVGCGVIGGLFASALTAVAKVNTYDANAEYVRAINAQNLRVIGKIRASQASWRLTTPRR